MKVISWKEVSEFIRTSDFLFETDISHYRFYQIRDYLHDSPYYLRFMQLCGVDEFQILLKKNLHSSSIIYSYWDLVEVNFEEVLENLPEHLQTKLLFHLDLFV